MSQVPVQKINSDQAQSSSMVEEVQSLAERIRERAYQLFENRGRSDGSALDDWLQAENDLVLIPQSDLVETNGNFEMHVAMPGFEPKDIEVDALPDSLVVRGQNAHTHQQKDGKVQFCEFGEKRVFRRFDLPAPIDTDHVNASLDKGLLTLTVPKANRAAKATA